jgi:hypothetical protein
VIGATDGVMDEKPMMFKSFLQVSSGNHILIDIIIFCFDVVGLCLRTAATNGPILPPDDDI